MEFCTPRFLAVAYVRYARRCFQREEPTSVQELADGLAMSRETLRARTAEALDRTPSGMLDVLRARQAIRLLRTGLPTAQVAYRSGFVSRRSFFRAFKRCGWAIHRANTANAGYN